MTLQYHKDVFPWKEVLKKAFKLGYYSHKTETCGLHVHVNKESLGDAFKEQEDVISRILYFVETFWNEMLKFSRRSEYQLKRWAARYGRKDTPMEVMDSAKNNSIGRYSCINLLNTDTIEFRMFKGTLRYNTLIAVLQMVEAICNTAILLDDVEITQLTWCGFVEKLSEKLYPEFMIVKNMDFIFTPPQKKY